MAVRAQQRAVYMGEEGFSWSHIRQALQDPKLYLSCILQFCCDLVLYGFSTFLPSILKLELGYTSLQAQYLSVPVFMLSALAVGSIC